jgi:predicted nucleic acid-binding protein
MILVDTSIWIEHLRSKDDRLAGLLEQGRVLCHRFVIGEIALGNLRNRDLILSSLADLPASAEASQAEVLQFILNHRLMGRGIGFIDAHLMASVFLSRDARLWTADRRLAAIASDLGRAFEP